MKKRIMRGGGRRMAKVIDCFLGLREKEEGVYIF
jgi:hypothetical protein